MKGKEFLWSFAAALVFAGAEVAQDVKVDWDKGADFSKYKTFAVKLGTAWGKRAQ